MTENPFRPVPMPVPLKGWDLQAPDIFQERALAKQLALNEKWLQARPRTSNQIEAAIYPQYCLNGMERAEVRAQLNRALWDAGYSPSDTDTDNPTWTGMDCE